MQSFQVGKNRLMRRVKGQRKEGLSSDVQYRVCNRTNGREQPKRGGSSFDEGKLKSRGGKRASV